VDRHYDEARAERAVKFFENVLVHTKGRWARVSFRLTDWQANQIIRPLFGSLRRDPAGEWVRQYRIAWLEMSRKNGKSEILAGIGLYLLTADGEEAAEVYGAAADRDQAALVFDVASRMVELSPVLRKQLKVVDSRKRIIDPRTASVYQVIAADHLGNLGQNPHGVLFDEVIAQPDGRLWDVLRTGMGARSQPLMVAATTAGNDPSSFAKAEHDYCLRVAEQPELDPARFVFARNTPADADPWDEAGWPHANPAIDDFLDREQLRAEAREARNDPRKENAFRQYRLNQWVQQATRWIPLEQWDRLGQIVNPERLTGRLCFGGLDLAATTDLAALAWLFPPVGEEPAQVLWRMWTPEAMVDVLDRSTGGLFSAWCREGFVTVTEGDAIDYDVIHQQLARDAARYDVREIGVDRWNSQATFNFMGAAGLPGVALSQGYVLSGAMKELEKLTRVGGLHHGGNPAARWCMGAAEVKRSTDDRIKLVKPMRDAAGKRVDAVAALIMALDRWLAYREAASPGFAFISL